MSTEHSPTIRLYGSRGALIAHLDAHLDARLFRSFHCAICGCQAFQETKTGNAYHVIDADSDHIAREN